jgi:hypothetical protein
MNRAGKWSRILVIVGLVAMLIGAIDPLEGSLVILPGIGMVALGALLGGSRYRKSLTWSFVLAGVGVGALWGLSAFGGIGGPGELSIWWGLLLLPYPAGWLMGLIGAIRRLREIPRGPVPVGAQ